MLQYIQKKIELLFLKNEWIALAVLLSFLFLLRLNHLYADPPESPVFIHLVVDEGWKIFDARNRVVFGKWHTNYSFPSQLIAHPLFNLMEFFAFQILGVGIIQARTVPLICTLLAFLLLYKLAKRNMGSRWGLLLLLLLGTDFTFLIFNRASVHETVCILFMVMTLFFACKGEEKTAYNFLAGFIAILSCAVKMYCIFMIPVCLIGYMWNENKNVMARIRHLILFIAGMTLGLLLAFLLWALFFNFSFRNVLFVFNSIFLKSYFSITGVVGTRIVDISHVSTLLLFLLRKLKGFTLFYLGGMVERHFVPIFLLCTYFIRIIRESGDKRKLTQPERFFIVWLLVGMFFFFLNTLTMRFRAWYLLTLLPPIYFLASVSLKKMIGDNNRELGNIRTKSSIICSILLHQIVLFVLFTWIFKSSFFTKLLSSKYNPGEIKWITLQFSWLISIVTALLIVLVKDKLFKRLPNKLVRTKHISSGRSIVLFFVLLHLSINGYSYFSWSRTAKYTVFNTSLELGNIMDENAVILGASNLCMENKVRLVQSGNAYVDRKQVSHILLRKGRKKPHATKVKLLKTYKIMGVIYYFYEKVVKNTSNLKDKNVVKQFQ